MTQQSAKVKGVVDIVFLIDVTGSMQPCIDALKANIATFVQSLTAADAQNATPVQDWRARVVGYRDYEFDAEPLVDHPFTRDPGALRQQLAGLTAIGGGDEPESLLDAIYKVATVGETTKGAQSEDPYRWRYRSEAARVVIVFTDATYKPKLVIPEARDGNLSDVSNVVMANRIILSIFAPNLACYDELSAIDKSEWEVIECNGTSPQEALKQFTSDTENFRNTLRQLARSVSKSSETVAL